METNPIICYCLKVDLQTIKAAIAEGVSSIEGISDKTGAGSGCGRCQNRIADILFTSGATKN